MRAKAQQAELARTMGGFGALLITLSGLSPTIGVFVVGADVIHQAGSGALIAFALAALLGVPIANVYAELASAYPETGGEYTIVGRLLGPAWGFAMLGLNLLTFTIAPAVTGLGVAAYLSVLSPDLPLVPVAVTAVVLCTGVAALNVRLNAWITGVFLAVELASLGLVAWLGFSAPHRGLEAVVTHPVLLDGLGRLQPVSLATFGVAAAGAIYAFDGYGAVVYLGEELQKAPERIAKVVFWSLGLAAVAQLTPLLAILVGAPQLKLLIASASPVSAFIATEGGPTLAKVVSLGVALALFNAMIALTLLGGRQLYSSGRDRAWGAMSASISRLHPSANSPWIATLVMGAAAAMWCLVRLPVLVTLIGDGTAAIYACMALAALKGRQKGLKPPYRMAFHPLQPRIALGVLACVGGADLFDPDGRKGLLAAGVTAAGFALYYRFVLRPRGAWTHRGPTQD